MIPFFSIIIPTFNRENFIAKTIESVLGQKFTDFEIIVIDDGSTDNTRAEVKKFDDPRLHYIYKDNEERAVARNTGVSKATGKYISFVDSDDILYENHLIEAEKMIKRYDSPQWFHLGFEIINAAKRRVREPATLPEIANENLVNGNCLSCNNVFLRKDVAEKYPFHTDRKLSGTEDYQLWLRLAARFPLYCSNEITSAIIQHDNRSVVSTNKQKLIERMSILETSLAQDSEFIKKFGQNFSFIKSVNRTYVALHLALAGADRAEVIKELFSAMRLSLGIVNTRMFYGTIKNIIFR